MVKVVDISRTLEYYLEDESRIPVIEVDGVMLYHLTQREKNLFVNFIRDVENVPSFTWLQWNEDVELQYSYWVSLAYRVVGNCVIKG